MTIVEIKNQIMGHFYEHDAFILETDGPKVELSDDINDMRRELLIAVLGELEASGIVKRVTSGAADVWVLTQSFESLNQSVVVSAPIGEAICETINSFREANGIAGDAPDKTKITQDDLMNLVNIIQVLLQSGDEIFDEENEGGA